MEHGESDVEIPIHVHVVPHPDSIEHSATPDCICGPKLDPPDPDDDPESQAIPCWRHQALDGDLAAQLPDPHDEDNES